MNRIISLNRLLATGAAVAAISALFLPIVYAGGDGKSDKKPETTASGSQKLTGQELYAINCNRCHSERYPTEWTPAQWKTLMLHMRVRANLPADQAKEILKYLEGESGN